MEANLEVGGGLLPVLYAIQEIACVRYGGRIVLVVFIDWMDYGFGRRRRFRKSRESPAGRTRPDLVAGAVHYHQSSSTEEVIAVHAKLSVGNDGIAEGDDDVFILSELYRPGA